MAMRLRTEIPELTGATEWVGGEVKKEDLLGKPILVNFWSISCGMCKASMPEVNEMREKYKKYGLQFVGVHMPRSDEMGPVKEAIEEYEMKHPQAIDNEHNIGEAFEHEYVPAFYLFDAEGKLRHRSAGEKALSMLIRPLERVLGIKAE